MKRAPKELLDAIERASGHPDYFRVTNALANILEEWQPINHSGAAYHTDEGDQAVVEILRKDVAEWKKRATEAEAALAKSYERVYAMTRKLASVTSTLDQVLNHKLGLK